MTSAMTLSVRRWRRGAEDRLYVRRSATGERVGYYDVSTGQIVCADPIDSAVITGAIDAWQRSAPVRDARVRPSVAALDASRSPDHRSRLSRAPGSKVVVALPRPASRTVLGDVTPEPAGGFPGADRLGPERLSTPVQVATAAPNLAPPAGPAMPSAADPLTTPQPSPRTWPRSIIDELGGVPDPDSPLHHELAQRWRLAGATVGNDLSAVEAAGPCGLLTLSEIVDALAALPTHAQPPVVAAGRSAAPLPRAATAAAANAPSGGVGRPRSLGAPTAITHRVTEPDATTAVDYQGHHRARDGVRTDAARRRCGLRAGATVEARVAASAAHDPVTPAPRRRRAARRLVSRVVSAA